MGVKFIDLSAIRKVRFVLEVEFVAVDLVADTVDHIAQRIGVGWNEFEELIEGFSKGEVCFSHR